MMAGTATARGDKPDRGRRDPDPDVAESADLSEIGTGGGFNLRETATAWAVVVVIGLGLLFGIIVYARIMVNYWQTDAAKTRIEIHRLYQKEGIVP